MSYGSSTNLQHKLPPIWKIEKELSERNLKDYIEFAWHVVEPGRKFVSNFHIDAIADHLQATVPKPVFSKFRKDQIIDWQPAEIQRLVINIPPGCTKSLTTSVFFPTFVWGPMNLPYLRFLFASYSQGLSTRDSIKCRRIIRSKWYQQNWGDRFDIVDDQDTKTRFENSKTGYRIASSFEGQITGDRCDIASIDDPINVISTLRPLQTELLNANETFDNGIRTRIDEAVGSIIITMQRLAVNDLCGHVFENDEENYKAAKLAGEILEKDFGYDRLILPMEYEGNRCKTKLGFIDPRKKEGELLDPIRFPKKAVKALKRDLKEYGTAGQLQQRPAPKGGGKFKESDFNVVGGLPNKTLIAAIRYWDKAGTEGGGSYTSGTLMLRYQSGFTPEQSDYYIADVKRGQWAAPEREKIIKNCATNDQKKFGHKYQVWIEQEGGSGGKESVENTIKNLAGIVCRADKVSGQKRATRDTRSAKEVRSEPYEIAVEAGFVYLVAGDWVNPFLVEHKTYPVGKYKDQIDSTAGAYNKLAKIKVVGVVK